LVHVLLALLLAARIAHAIAMFTLRSSPLYLACRAFGAGMTLCVMTFATLYLGYLLVAWS
jgi:uncharacterized membrane protein YecN with MAPEG domain